MKIMMLKWTLWDVIGYACLGMSIKATMDNQCLVQFQHILCTVAAPHLHSRSYGTIIRTGIACKKNFLYKNLLNSAWIWSRARLAINKKQKYFLLPVHQLAEDLILVFGSKERANRG